MKVGPELDALVAEKVMGWEVWEHKNIGLVEVVTEDDTFYLDNFKPSSYIKDTWDVVGKFPFIDIRKRPKGYFVEIVGEKGIVSYIGKSAPQAICLAALKAVGVEVSDEQSSRTT